MPITGRLDVLRQLRQMRSLSQAEVAPHFGFEGQSGRVTISRWESGTKPPALIHRSSFISYLLDKLELRRDLERFYQVWQILCDEWKWLPLSDQERKYYGISFAETGEEIGNDKINRKIGSVIYDSRNEIRHFRSLWEYYSSVDGHDERFNIITRMEDGLLVLEIKAFSGEDVGANKDFPYLFGRVEFDYKIIHAQPDVSVIAFYIIPIQKVRRNKIEYTELVLETPQGRLSYRKRFTPPSEFVGDGSWHRACIEFDFREISQVLHCIFAPRINEDCPKIGAAHFLVSDIQFIV
jgi:transcriptional regulator with XRE-family HTH domain